MVTTMVCAQDTDYQVGAELYRYRSTLSDTLYAFSSVNTSAQYFPCVDAFTIEESATAGATFEMKTVNGAKEYYALHDDTLSLVAYVGEDPFMGIPAKTIQYYNHIPIVIGGDKSNFRDEGYTDFIIDYKKREWPAEIVEWTSQNNISIVRINGRIEWDNNFVDEDVFRDLYLDLQYGDAIEYILSYTVTKLQVKKEKWETVNLDEVPMLKKYFHDKRTEHRSFYRDGSIMELARLGISPNPEFYFQTSEDIGRYVDCRHQFNTIYVFPNPTFDDIKIRFENATDDKYVLSLHNVVGRKLWSKNLSLVKSTQELDVDLPRLDKGIYMYTVRNIEGKIITSRRLVIMEL